MPSGGGGGSGTDAHARGRAVGKFVVLNGTDLLACVCKVVPAASTSGRCMGASTPAMILRILDSLKCTGMRPENYRDALEITSYEAQQVQDLLEDTARQFAREGLQLKMAFAGLNRGHEACIASQQILRVLDSLILVNVESSAAHALCQRYAAHDAHRRRRAAVLRPLPRVCE
ncbi:hypothetical protein JKP88DRAFT_253328 [Tribonema minus]|uniref:Uncharacterized protein n=1 Tax=Tribonema minus TaxID=303371 RepID=A0A835ZAB7_9STRA|nr:hypothetical protein JKP88DRAFT_253328 [Tribonema minus]